MPIRTQKSIYMSKILHVKQEIRIQANLKKDNFSILVKGWTTE
jgi:hypothetical protein